MSGLRTLLPLCLSLIACGSSEAARSSWQGAGEAQVRLLALRAPGNATVAAGVEIAMTPGWHTYWRNPGDAGIPPLFDFSASENVGSVSVGYPAPERHNDGASVSVVYKDQVVFPVRIRARDATRPMRLRLAAKFGVCSEICIPVALQAELEVPIEASEDPLAEATLAQAAERLPAPPAAGEFEIRNVTLDSPDVLTIAVTAPQSHRSDLFVEGPPGWLVAQPELVRREGEVLRYTLAITGRPAGASMSGQLLRFVAVAGSRAIEDILRVP